MLTNGVLLVTTSNNCFAGLPGLKRKPTIARVRGGADMICSCMKCRFVFESTGLLERCPDCGHGPVRLATNDEIAQYAENRRLYGPMRVYWARYMTGNTRKGCAISGS